MKQAYFIITSGMRVYETTDFNESMKEKAKEGELVVFSSDKRKFYGKRSRWESVENWSQPIVAAKTYSGVTF